MIGNLGLVTETEERLDAAGAHAAADDLGHLGELVGPGRGGVGQHGEGAVAAAVPAEIGERDEEVARDTDDFAFAAALALAGAFEQSVEHPRGVETSADPLRRRALEATRVHGLDHEALGFAPAEQGFGGGCPHLAVVLDADPAAQLRRVGLMQEVPGGQGRLDCDRESP